jgi:hypothetical protein
LRRPQVFKEVTISELNSGEPTVRDGRAIDNRREDVNIASGLNPGNNSSETVSDEEDESEVEEESSEEYGVQ